MFHMFSIPISEYSKWGPKGLLCENVQEPISLCVSNGHSELALRTRTVKSILLFEKVFVIAVILKTLSQTCSNFYKGFTYVKG